MAFVNQSLTDKPVPEDEFPDHDGTYITATRPLTWSAGQIKMYLSLLKRDDTVDDTTRVYRYFKSHSHVPIVWRHDGSKMEYCFSGLDVWHDSGLTPDYDKFTEITAGEADEILFGGAQASIPDRSSTGLVERNPPATPPTGDPVTEAFYRDRLAAAERCTFGTPNPADKADHDARVARMTVREHDLEKMAAVEKEAGYSWFEEDEYKRITGYTERKRK